MASPSGPRPPLHVAECPQVAELIEYARNRLAGEAKNRIDTHLRGGACRDCQGWLDRARKLPPPIQAASASTADSAQWQRQAFRDLEERLRQLRELTE